MGSSAKSAGTSKSGYYSYLLMFGHICTDINQGALPAILPFLVASNNIGYASAAGLVFAANFVSSIVQPLFGYLGDKASYPWLTSLGIILAGSGLAAVGFLNNYWAIFLSVMISGLGIALFHPEGSRIANLASGEKKSTGMSNFAAGGSIGFALGPLIASMALTTFGIKGTAVLLIPAWAMAAILLISFRRLPIAEAEAAAKNLSADTSGSESTSAANGAKDDWPAFAKLSAAVFARSIILYGMTTFIPLYWVGVLLQSSTSGSMKLTLFSLSGACATLIGGRLADRYGFNKIIRIGFTAMVPLLLLLAYTKNVYFATFLLIPIALTLNGPYSTMVTMGQCFLPNHIGLAGGITLGLGVSVGGIAVPAIGWLGDHYGLSVAMYTIAAVGLISTIFAYFIPQYQTVKCQSTVAAAKCATAESASAGR
ncbi:MAG: MFS transporter [Clostridiales bacterium]